MANQVQWFVRKENKNYGPYSAQRLKQLAVASMISCDTLVRRGIDDKWVPARKVQGLFSAPEPVNVPAIPVAAAIVTPSQSVPPKPPTNIDSQPCVSTDESNPVSMRQPNQQEAPSKTLSIGKKVLKWFITTVITTSIVLGIGWAIKSVIKQNNENKINEVIQKVIP